MKSFVMSAALVFAATCASAQESRPSYVSPSATKLDVAVLYAGATGDPRTADFVAFLQATFAKVGAIDVGSLDVAAAKDYDVVIVDGPSPYKADDTIKLPDRRAPEVWTRPTILVGAAGGAFVRKLKLKIDWW